MLWNPSLKSRTAVLPCVLYAASAMLARPPAAAAQAVPAAEGKPYDLPPAWPAFSLAVASPPNAAPRPFSSSAAPEGSTKEAPEPDPAAGAPFRGKVKYPKPPLANIPNTRTFSAFALAVGVGSGGLGLDLATPLNSRFNLRGGASFFTYTTSFTTDSVPIDGTLHVANAHLGVDWFPLRGSFHISPGIVMYNNVNYNALIFIPGGQVVTLNDQDYTSDPNDPIHGTAYLKFGNRVAPRLTVGFGNMIPHNPHERNWTFPFEIGVQYQAAPTALFLLGGSSCDINGDCGPIQNDPSTQTNILVQQNQIVNELSPLRFFPIVSFGVSYKFGH